MSPRNNPVGTDPAVDAKTEGTSSTAASSRTQAAGAGDAPPRQTRPRQADIHYPVARMTFVTISTEELATLAFSSGVGSIGLSGTIYCAKQIAGGVRDETTIVALVFLLATAVAAYAFFGGLFRRVRSRSGLSSWGIFSE